MNLLRYFTFLVALFPALVLAQETVAIDSTAPETLSAKSFLEDLLNKRYTQDLSTRLQKDAYSISSQIDLVKPKEAPNKYEVIDDLMLGNLDPEELAKKLAGPDGAGYMAGLLNQYRISAVRVSVGLDEKLGEDKKKEIQAWVDERLKKEFGAAGKGEVVTIVLPKVETPAPNLLDLLKTFQDLAGQIVLALALVLGAILWGLLSGKSSSTNESAGNQSISLNTGGDGASKSNNANESLLSIEKRQKEQELYIKDISNLTEKLVALTPKVTDHLPGILQSWSNQGEAGKLRLVCYAEAIGKEIGKLPIPQDSVADITKVFLQMPHVQFKEKRDCLEKAYWDILAVLNLGEESLNQPFSYLGALNVDAVQEVLIDHNTKMKTLVSLYMPEDLRSKYIGNMDTETKKGLLQSAAELTEVPLSELRNFDGTLSDKVKSKGKGGDGVVYLDMTLNKIVTSLKPIEKILLLKDISGPGADLFKRNVPTLAFIHEWPEEAVGKLIGRSKVEELVTLCRLRPEMQDKVLSLAPPMTAEMAKDELSRQDVTSDSDKNRLLDNLEETIRMMVDEKELDLEALFVQTGTSENTTSAAA